MTLIKNSFPLTPLSKLRHGHDEGAPAGVCNVRIAGREDGLDELVASIASVGLLQPLVVVRHEGLSYVADGNRRLAALLRLAAAGTIAEDHEIDVVERDAATAREAGLAGNLNQRAMHEADQTLAFAELAAAGMKARDISARFGVAITHVKRLLALGSVAPAVLDAWRVGKLGITQVQAFTLAPIAEQESAFEKLSRTGHLWPNAIREELGADHSTERLLQAVGLDAYKAAGGHVVQDLFGEGHGVSDKSLLKRLADDRLVARRDELRAQGWGWVEIETDLPPHARYMWSTIKDVIKLEPSETQVARLAEIETLLEAEYDGGMSDAEADALSAEHRAIEADLTFRPGNGDRPRSGCIVSLGYDGEISVREYVLRPDEAKDSWPGEVDGQDPVTPQSKGLSSALMDRLSVQLTQAVQDSLDLSPRAAIAAMLAGAMCAHPWQSPMRMRFEGLGAAEASVRGSGTFEPIFRRYLAMPMPELLASVGMVLARGIDLRTWTPGAGTCAGAPADSPAIQALAGAIEADTLAARMRERFDAQDFFSSAPKAVTMAAIEEACGAEAAARAGKLRKGELVALAVETVVPTGWLPREVRWPGYAGPGADQALADAA